MIENHSFNFKYILPQGGMQIKESTYLDGVKQTEEALQNFLKGDIPIKFDWENRWLKGEEYAHILNRIEEYCGTFNL